jgi:hypothetical protein
MDNTTTVKAKTIFGKVVDIVHGRDISPVLLSANIFTNPDLLRNNLIVGGSNSSSSSVTADAVTIVSL